jgi:hypothetical protein
MRCAALLALAALAPGCALDAAVRVVTTARERCEWIETVALGARDRYRVPTDVASAELRIREGPASPLAPGALVETAADGDGLPRLTLDGRPLPLPPGASADVRVTLTRRRDDPVEAAQEFPVPADALPWAIDWEVRPTPRRVAGGEGRLEDVQTTVTLVGPDADALVLEVEVREGRVRGTVRRKVAP